MMDKEAWEKIAVCVVKWMMRRGELIELPLDLAQDIADKLAELGYRKLPKDKPPLLSGDWEQVFKIQDAVADKWADAGASTVLQNGIIEGMKAQREADIKHYDY